jgi:hypothetical protein
MGSGAVHSTAIVFSFLMTGCAAGRAQPSIAPEARLGEAFTLGVSESKRVEATDLTVSFDGVSSDSRCPKDVNCIQAGEALVQLALQTGGGEKTVIDLTVPPGGSSATKSFGAFLITIVELDPQKISTQEIDPSAYVATIKITRA